MEFIEITRQALGQTFNSFASALPGIIGALVLLIVGYFIAKIIARIIRKALQMAKVDVLADKLQEVEDWLIHESNLIEQNQRKYICDYNYAAVNTIKEEDSI